MADRQPRSFSVPDAVRAKAEQAGASGWLAGLPRQIAAIEQAWKIEVGAPLHGGSEAFVAEAVMHDGRPVVLKLHIPRPGRDAADEITALRLADGRGCARLYHSDADHGALLLERLGPSLSALGLPLARRHAILCETVARFWRPAANADLRSGAEKGRWLVDFVSAKWEALGRPCTERAVSYAIACAQRRVTAHRDDRSVLVHGDVHQWNALRSGRGFKLIDPDGLRAEPEYDLGILMREDSPELLTGDPWDRAHALASRMDLDAVAIWEWGAVERVSTGLLLLAIGLEQEGQEMLQAAEYATGFAR